MSVVKVYKEEDFDNLVQTVESAQLTGYTLSSVKFDCHKDPMGRVLFWYAVVIFDFDNIDTSISDYFKYQGDLKHD